MNRSLFKAVICNQLLDHFYGLIPKTLPTTNPHGLCRTSPAPPVTFGSECWDALGFIRHFIKSAITDSVVLLCFPSLNVLDGLCRYLLNTWLYKGLCVHYSSALLLPPNATSLVAGAKSKISARK